MKSCDSDIALNQEEISGVHGNLCSVTSTINSRGHFGDTLSSIDTSSRDDESCEVLENECSKVIQIISSVDSKNENSFCPFQSAIRDLSSALNELQECSEYGENSHPEGSKANDSSMNNSNANEISHSNGTFIDSSYCTQQDLTERNDSVSKAKRKAIIHQHGHSSDYDHSQVKEHSHFDHTIPYDINSNKAMQEECDLLSDGNYQMIDSAVKRGTNVKESKPDEILGREDVALLPSTSCLNDCSEYSNHRDLTLKETTGALSSSASILSCKDSKSDVVSNDDLEALPTDSSNSIFSSLDCNVCNTDLEQVVSSPCAYGNNLKQSVGPSEHGHSNSVKNLSKSDQNSEDLGPCTQKESILPVRKDSDKSRENENDLTHVMSDNSSESMFSTQFIIKSAKGENILDHELNQQNYLAKHDNKDNSVGDRDHSFIAGCTECGKGILLNNDISKLRFASNDSLQFARREIQTNKPSDKLGSISSSEERLKGKAEHNHHNAGEKMTEERALKALRYAPKITSLDVSSISFHSSALGSACLKFFSKANSHLKEFSITWSLLDDDTLIYMLKNEPELLELNLVSFPLHFS